MSSLQQIYLANVILYCKTETVLRNLRMVSKRCRDAIRMLRIQPALNYPNYQFINQFFPNINTLYGRINTITKQLKPNELEQIHWFDLSTSITFCQDIPLTLYSKIKKLYIYASDFEYVTKFCNLETLIIEVNKPVYYIDTWITKSLKHLLLKNKNVENMNFKDVLNFSLINMKVQITFIDFDKPKKFNKTQIHFLSSETGEECGRRIKVITTPKYVIFPLLSTNNFNTTFEEGLREIKIVINQCSLKTINLTHMKFLTSFSLETNICQSCSFTFPKGIVDLKIIMSKQDTFSITNDKELSQLHDISLYGSFDSFELSPMNSFTYGNILLSSFAKTCKLKLPYFGCNVLSLIGNMIIDVFHINCGSRMNIIELNTPKINKYILEATNKYVINNIFDQIKQCLNVRHLKNVTFYNSNQKISYMVDGKSGRVLDSINLLDNEMEELKKSKKNCVKGRGLTNFYNDDIFYYKHCNEIYDDESYEDIESLDELDVDENITSDQMMYLLHDDNEIVIDDDSDTERSSNIVMN
ncbi:Uncharacterized protein QTN25_010402 [Entamoeba marina]